MPDREKRRCPNCTSVVTRTPDQKHGATTTVQCGECGLRMSWQAWREHPEVTT